MDLLSRGFTHLIDGRFLRGVKVARTAKPISDCLYADDLLIFGATTTSEVHAIMHNINAFTAVSGKQIGPDKSVIWFSKATPSHVQQEIARLLSIPQQATCQKYLGAPILEGRDAYDFLIDDFSSRLQVWKGRLLSHTGRAILIKSMLQSISVYHMSTAMLPKRVIKALTNIIRRFFWRKVDSGRYMTYVAWDKITRPIKEGGLGIRDLWTVNEALLMKLLWRLAKEQNSQWVDIVRAKYFPRSLMWLSGRNYCCTMFWRAMMNLREKLLPLISWNIVSGECMAFDQPWATGIMQHAPQNSMQAQLRVRDLIDQDSGCWDVQQLVNLFGNTTCMHILGMIRPPGIGHMQGVQDLDRPMRIRTTIETDPCVSSRTIGPDWPRFRSDGCDPNRNILFISKDMDSALLEQANQGARERWWPTSQRHTTENSQESILYRDYRVPTTFSEFNRQSANSVLLVEKK